MFPLYSDFKEDICIVLDSPVLLFLRTFGIGCLYCPPSLMFAILNNFSFRFETANLCVGWNKFKFPPCWICKKTTISCLKKISIPHQRSRWRMSSAFGWIHEYYLNLRKFDILALFSIKKYFVFISLISYIVFLFARDKFNQLCPQTIPRYHCSQFKILAEAGVNLCKTLISQICTNV